MLFAYGVQSEPTEQCNQGVNIC